MHDHDWMIAYFGVRDFADIPYYMEICNEAT